MALLVSAAACSATAHVDAAKPAVPSVTAPSPTPSPSHRLAPRRSVRPSPTPVRTTIPPQPRAAGLTVVLDAGHDGGNGAHPDEINRQVPAGNGATKACDTVGASTNAGYPESAFTFDVAGRVAAILTSRGVRVILTRVTNVGVGPCVDQRAAIGNAAHADAVVSIHADGGPSGGQGFHVIWPAPSDRNGGIVEPSHRLALVLRDRFRTVTGEPTATYTASDGLAQRSDLAGLNLSVVPKVFIECANMRNPADAGRVTDPAWRQQAAEGIADGLLAYLA